MESSQSIPIKPQRPLIAELPNNLPVKCETWPLSIIPVFLNLIDLLAVALAALTDDKPVKNLQVEVVHQLLGYDLYSHYEDGLTAGPLGYYIYGSPEVLFNDSDE
jgi:hypothetical protein